LLLASLAFLAAAQASAQAPSSPPSPAAASTSASAASGATATASGKPAQPPGTLRCGWFENPSPGNAWLTDVQGEWLIGAQGGHQAEGDWPRFPPHRWVRRQASYGHGCACLRVSSDADHRVLKIHSAASRPLRVCRADQALSEPLPN
jgi:hypothetical protein